MNQLLQIEKGTCMKLFNRNGYILKFSTNDFDVFTLESVGVALCEKYQQSKGKSLMAFIGESPECDTIKFLGDLLEYYESHFEYEIANEPEYSKTYYRCKEIMDRIKSSKMPLASNPIVFVDSQRPHP